MSRILKVIARCCLLVLIMRTDVVAGETLEEYAKKCDAEMGGVTVRDFICDDGTKVPITHNDPNAIYPDGNCDEPNRLNEACDKGSMFQVLANTPNVYVVA